MKKEFIFRVVLAMGIFLLVYQFGIKPLFRDVPINSSEASNTYDWSKGFSSTKKDSYDVIVYGEQPDGVAAAVSAARLGAKTLLLSEGGDIGGIVSRCMLPDLEIPFGRDGKVLNGGILSELYKKLGAQFSPDGYISAAESIISKEKNLDVRYNVSLDSLVSSDGIVSSLNVTAGGRKITFQGSFFIDATKDGTLLDACKVPYTTGSSDLNMAKSFMPPMLDFEMEGSDNSEIKALLENEGGTFFNTLKEYKPINTGTRLDQLKIYYTGENKIIIQGLEMNSLDVTDSGQMEEAYKDTVGEAENLAAFLSNRFEQFSNWRFLKAANGFYIRENRHYTGLDTLSVNNILDNSYPKDTVVLGSYPMDMDKFVKSGIYLAGQPVQYGIPLGCLIPFNTENVLMTGAKASYSSLASSSAGSLGTDIASGEAAGLTAVYCLIKDIKPSDIVNDSGKGLSADLRSFMEAQGFKLPKAEIENKNAGNWSYSSVRQLLTLGLVAGGTDNNFNFDAPAKQKDLAIILLNGIYRLNRDSYTLDLDTRVRPFFNDNILTKDKAAEILEALYNLHGTAGDAYSRMCESGCINDLMQLKLKNKNVLTMDDVYYLGAYNIRKYTLKDIKD